MKCQPPLTRASRNSATTCVYMHAIRVLPCCNKLLTFSNRLYYVSCCLSNVHYNNDSPSPNNCNDHSCICIQIPLLHSSHCVNTSISGTCACGYKEILQLSLQAEIAMVVLSLCHWCKYSPPAHVVGCTQWNLHIVLSFCVQ